MYQECVLKRFAERDGILIKLKAVIIQLAQLLLRKLALLSRCYWQVLRISTLQCVCLEKPFNVLFGSLNMSVITNLSHFIIDTKLTLSSAKKHPLLFSCITLEKK